MNVEPSQMRGCPEAASGGEWYELNPAKDIAIFVGDASRNPQLQIDEGQRPRAMALNADADVAVKIRAPETLVSPVEVGSIVERTLLNVRFSLQFLSELLRSSDAPAAIGAWWLDS